MNRTANEPRNAMAVVWVPLAPVLKCLPLLLLLLLLPNHQSPPRLRHQRASPDCY